MTLQREQDRMKTMYYTQIVDLLSITVNLDKHDLHCVLHTLGRGWLPMWSSVVEATFMNEYVMQALLFMWPTRQRFTVIDYSMIGLQKGVCHNQNSMYMYVLYRQPNKIMA